VNPAKGQFNPRAERAMEQGTQVNVDQDVRLIEKYSRVGVPISGDALGRIRLAREAGFKTRAKKDRK